MFMCKTEHPASAVTWRKGLLELRASGKHVPSQEGLTLKLTINALERADSDTYTCDIGQARTQARLLVHGESALTCMLLSAPLRVCWSSLSEGDSGGSEVLSHQGSSCPGPAQPQFLYV